jgi:hypothetical protein
VPAIKTWESISARHAKQGAKSKRYLDSVTYVHLARDTFQVSQTAKGLLGLPCAVTPQADGPASVEPN